MTGLYIHIPFCEKKCHYCNFVITTNNSEQAQDDFLEAIEKEIRYRKLSCDGVIFDTLYLGGGTPSRLDALRMTRLFELLRRNFGFSEFAEITCECNPEDVTEEKAKLLKNLGINRISLGAQTFDDNTLSKINRTHSALDIEDSFSLLRDLGFDNISMDLILALPEQKLSEVQESLRRLLRMKPEHVSVYELTVEKSTVFDLLYRRGLLKTASEEEQFQMLSLARQTLQSYGYRHYELLNYAKPGFEAKHNSLYWHNESTLGLGPGAYSYWNGERFQFSASVESYYQKIRTNQWQAHESEALSGLEAQKEAFILSLRLLDEGASLKRFHELLPHLKKDIDVLIEKKLLVRDESCIRLSEQGQFFAEDVFSQLI